MSSLPLFTLHWGLVNATKNVSGVEPMGRVVPPIAGGAISKGVTGQGRIKTVTGMGRVKAIKGRGKTKTVKGRGRLC